MTQDSQVSLWLDIHPRAPLLLGSVESVGNFNATQRFIPGAALRGAVARKALEDCSRPEFKHNHAACPEKETCPFWQLFGTDDISFGNAHSGDVAPVYPPPLTARTCKYHPGFAADNTSQRPAHGVWDTLLSTALYDALTDPQSPARQVLFPELGNEVLPLPTAYAVPPCSECGGRPTPQERAYISGYPLRRAQEPNIARQVHVGINRQRFAAEDALLFTQEVIEAQGGSVHFWSEIHLSSSKVEVFKQYLGDLRLGRGYTRGYGLANVQPTTSPTVLSPLEERLKNFNQQAAALLTRWRQEIPEVPKLEGHRLFSLTLTSPLILERFGTPHLVPTPEEIGIPQARLLRAWTEPETIGGWDSAAGLPRRTRLTACAGSVYLYAIPAGDIPWDILHALEANGLGEERVRSYGRLLLCAPIHYDNAMPQNQ